jgi:hypothetical protein
MKFHPSKNLAYENEYVITVSDVAMDSAGNTLRTWGPSRFTTTEEQSSLYLLIDHTAVQYFDQIPDYWLEQAKALTVHYGHTSHGSQIVTGLYYLETYKDPVKYSIAINEDWDSPGLPPEENPPALRMWVQGLHPEEYWNSEEGINKTRAVAETGLFNYSMWSWCGEVSYFPTESIQEYLDTLDMLESEYPGMRFIYMTGHRDYPDPDEPLHNDMIREYCRDNGKILYDFADIESWDPDGNYYPETTDDCEWADQWCADHPEECINIPGRCEVGSYTCCAHTHGFNCVIKGKAFWYMMARLAGWDGQLE